LYKSITKFHGPSPAQLTTICLHALGKVFREQIQLVKIISEYMQKKRYFIKEITGQKLQIYSGISMA